MGSKPHISWLICAGSLGLLVGVASAPYIYARAAAVTWFTIGLLFFVASISKVSRRSLAVIFCAGLLFGIARSSPQLKSMEGYREYVGSSVRMEGRISEDPGVDNDGDYQVKLKGVRIDGEPIEGVVWVSVSGRVDIRRSDVVVVEGKISKGFGSLPAAMYRARLIEVTRQDFADVGLDVRDSFARGVRASIKEPEASLASGFLLGQKTALPEKLDNELRLLGLTHIVVASGYNLTILVRFCRKFFVRISRFTALAASGFLVYGFVQITGFSPSMTRAALITGLSLITWFYGRRMHPAVLLPFSAAVTLLINPSYAWGDIGWLLSFTSFIGVIILSPLLHKYFWGDQKPSAVRQVLLETLSAQILTLPIVVFVFGQYSPAALLANALILPFIPIAMLLTFIAGFVSLLAPFAAAVAGYPAETLLKYMTRITDIMASWPNSSREASASAAVVVAGYLVILCVITYLARRTKFNFREHNIVE